MATAPTPATILCNIDLAINAKVTGIIDGAVKEFSIRDKRITEYSLTELLDLRKEFSLIASALAVGGIKKVVVRNVGWH